MTKRTPEQVVEECVEAVEQSYVEAKRPIPDMPRISAFAILDALRAEGMLVEEPERDEFLAASIAVWREIDRLSDLSGGYRGLDASTDLRIRERRAWDAYRDALAAHEARKATA